MIAEKLKIAAEKLPVPQSTFKHVVEKMAQKDSALRKRVSERIMRGIIVIKDE